MIDMKPKFITTNDFLNYWGIDLNAKLKGNSTGPNNAAEMFLKRIEDRLMTWVDANTFRLTPWDYYTDTYVYRNENEKKIADYKKDFWKKAILTQAFYVFKNSDIGLDSGYDPEKGIVAEKSALDEIEICRPAIDLLKSAGLYNHIVKNRFRYTTLS